jgi:hypothetical protein
LCAVRHLPWRHAPPHDTSKMLLLLLLLLLELS